MTTTNQTTWTAESVAAELIRCETERTDREPFTDDWPDLDVDTAYAIQDATLDQRLARGEQLVGVKLGLTSKAKQQTMSVDSPIVAWLTDAMVLPTDGPARVSDFIHPRVEPELVVTLAHDLKGPGITPAQALDAVASVLAGVEVIDSRYRNFRFTHQDVVADNASSGAYLSGPIAKTVPEVDLSLEAVLVEADGKVINSATGAAIMGHPAEALAAAANMLGARGITLKAGWVILLGAMTDAVPVQPGTTLAFHYTTLGSIYLSWED
ncbi:MAG: 4-oxalocrotonate decarboxylase [Actinomycetales bacterium]|nr:4-oxalocrotonate decarboxylase [Actinomycetales bacterium]